MMIAMVFAALPLEHPARAANLDDFAVPGPEKAPPKAEPAKPHKPHKSPPQHHNTKSSEDDDEPPIRSSPPPSPPPPPPPIPHVQAPPINSGAAALNAREQARANALTVKQQIRAERAERKAQKRAERAERRQKAPVIVNSGN
jgi:hypothetical protein